MSCKSEGLNEFRYAFYLDRKETSWAYRLKQSEPFEDFYSSFHIERSYKNLRGWALGEICIEIYAKFIKLDIFSKFSYIEIG